MQKINKALDETMRNLINENKKDKELIIMNANIEQVLEHLEPERDMER